jgi:hypothetical protein
MNQDDRPAFLEILMGMAELRGKELTAVGIALYWKAMMPWPLDEFRKAANHLTRSLKFFPQPSDFWDLRQAGEPTSGEAWFMVLDLIRKGGHHHGGRVDHPLVHAAVEHCGGYYSIGMSDETSLQFRERRFKENYEQIRDVGFVREVVPAISSRTLDLKKLAKEKTP